MWWGRGPQDHSQTRGTLLRTFIESFSWLWCVRIKGKVQSNTRGAESREIKCTCPRVLSCWNHTGCASSHQPVRTPHVNCSLPGKLLRDSVPKVAGGWSRRHSLSCAPPPPRLPEGRQLCIHHIVHVNSSGTMRLLFSVKVAGTSQKSKLPDDGQGPTLDAGWEEVQGIRLS